jgi:hypothetical protein
LRWDTHYDGLANNDGASTTSSSSRLLTTHLVVAILIVAVVLLTGWNFFNQSSFYRDYNHEGSFQGQRYECLLGGLNAEVRTLCLMGADDFGLYILPHPKPRRLFWGSGYYIFKKSLLIPWRDMDCSRGKVLFKKRIWFKLGSRRIYLYVPEEIAAKLLTDAGRKIPN